MRKNRIISLILCCIIAFSGTPISALATEAEIIDVTYTADYVPGEIIITTSGEIIDSSSVFTAYSNDDNYTPINFEETKINEIEQLETYSNSDDERTYVIEVSGDVLEKCKELEKLPGVECAEPNQILHTMGFTMPNEILYGSLYSQHMKWYFDLMQIPEAWQTFEATGEEIVVAVIDNGYDINSSDFSTNLWTDENGNHGWNTYKNSADISPIYKSDGTEFSNTGHGTHVAGVIGASANGINIIGAAYNAKLMLINAAHYNSDSKIPDFEVSDIVEAINFAREKGADIINLSLGAITTSVSLESAVKKAYDDGIAIIAAAGNQGTSTTSGKAIPAAYPNVIGVMASDKTNTSQLANFSNYDPSGNYYDVAAPGYQILSCSVRSGKFAYSSGTSQASPLVAACAALYLSKYPDATVDDLYEAIRNSPTQKVKANSERTSSEYYFKFLNAYELLDYGKVTPELTLNLDTGVTTDPTNNYIYGLNERYSSIYDYVNVAEGTGTSEFIASENGNGTGSVLKLFDNDGNLFKTYHIIIFGDLNGDAVADGQDAVITSCIINSPDIFENYQHFAADVDFDNQVSEYDYYITANYAIGLDFVFQTR